MAKGSYIGQVQIGSDTYPVGSLLYGTASYDTTNNYWTVNNNNLTTATFTNDNLTAGVTIHIKFNAINSADTPKLKVGNATEKAIVKYGTTNVGKSAATSWVANSIVSFTYDGTSWVMNTGIDSNDNTTYTFVEGSTNGAFSVTPSGGSAQSVSIHGLSNAAYKDVSTSIPASGTADDAKLPTVAAVKTLVNNSFAANDAMVFKGTLGTGGTITSVPTSGYSAGATYKVITAGTYAGYVCEDGDLLIAITDATEGQTGVINNHWTSVQTNDSGLVTGPVSSTTNNIALYNDATGKVIKDSGVTLNTSSGSTTKWLTEKGTWTTPNATNVGLGNVTNDAQITKATFTAAYQIMYSTNASAPTVLNANTTTTKKFLSMTGTGSAGAAPTWSTFNAGSLPSTSNTNNDTLIGSVADGTLTIYSLNKGSLPSFS